MRKFYCLLTFCIGFTSVAQSPQITLTINEPGAICAESCTDLTAVYTHLRQTTSYTVSMIPYIQAATIPTTYSPSPVSGLIPANADDTWSPIINLPFNFSFYGTWYNQLLVGTNGVITFDIVNQTPLQYCNWLFNTMIPDANFGIKNAIFGVYQDTDISIPPVVNPAIQNVNYMLFDQGEYAAPNRVFVANFNELPQFRVDHTPDDNLQTSQIVLHEGTNIIEVIVKKRVPNPNWNSGSGLIGLLNTSGTQAVVAPARNTGTWSTTQEAWRFTPSGDMLPANITWSSNGGTIGTDNPITVCAESETTYTATLTYTDASIEIAKDITLSPIASNLEAPMDLQACGDGSYIINLTENELPVMANVNPSHYAVSYYESLEQAEVGLAPIEPPESYSFSGNQTIYMRLENVFETGCHYVFPFEIEGILAPQPPTGSAIQPFVPGQTLSDLTINGQNIQWYDHPTAGNLLPAHTAVTDNTTYYASQSIGGCESRMLPQRLAVTVSSTLGNTGFTAASVALFPNPAENSLTVAFPETISKTEIFNTLGQLVLTSNANSRQTTIDVSSLSRGQYFVKVYAADQQVISKFIKK